MGLSTESRVTSAWGYSSILEVHLEDPPTDEDGEASTQELRLGYTRRPSGIPFRTLASALLLLGATVASLTWATSFRSSSSESWVNADGGDSLMTIGLAEAANGTEAGNTTASGGDGKDGGDIRIKVCRNKDCDKFHPHGLVHEYNAKLNTCEEIPAEDSDATANGEYKIVGATAATLAEGTTLTAKQCGNTTDRVQHSDFSLTVGAFTDCCSFRHGGCGFKCITFKLGKGGAVANETVPPATSTAAESVATQMATTTAGTGPTSAAAASNATTSAAAVAEENKTQMASTTAGQGPTSTIAGQNATTPAAVVANATTPPGA